MEVLKNNKGLIIFYMMLTIFLVLWVNKIDKENDYMMHEKNMYLLKETK